MGVSVCNETAQVGPNTDACKDYANDARPGIERDPNIGGHDPSCHDFNDQYAEAGNKNDDVSFDHFALHLRTSPLDILY